MSVLDERTDSNRVPDVMVLSIQTTMSSLPLEWQFLCSKSSPDKVTSSLWHEEHLVEIFVWNIEKYFWTKLERGQMNICLNFRVFSWNWCGKCQHEGHYNFQGGGWGKFPLRPKISDIHSAIQFAPVIVTRLNFFFFDAWGGHFTCGWKNKRGEGSMLNFSDSLIIFSSSHKNYGWQIRLC